MAVKPIHKPIRIGDRVRFRFGNSSMIGIVREDRGPIGVGGRRLYLVQYLLSSGGLPSLVEIPAEELQVTNQGS
jgi:hypothetical protein